MGAFGRKRRLALLIAMIMLCGAMLNQAMAEQEEAEEPVISFGYDIGLQIPEEHAEAFVRTQKVRPAPITEVFSMKIDGREVPLFRIDFGNESIGEQLGVLQTEFGDVAVTYMMFPVSEEEIAAMDEETSETYYALMENFNLVLDAICADPRFTDEDISSIGKSYEAKLTHWTLTLPGRITCSESAADGVYKAVFYGRIQGENVELYSVSIGGEKGGVLGMYVLDGEKKPLTVEIHEPEQNVFWFDEDYDMAYQLLDTVNDVIDAIMAHENFEGGY